MAKSNAKLLDKAVEQITELWEAHNKKFFQALEDSDRRKIKLIFGVDIDLSESAPVVDTELSFKDKTRESGMDVVKVFHSTRSEQLDDPNAPALPGMEKGKGKKAKEGED